jgi:predicted MFS family arabinose efflux permease
LTSPAPYRGPLLLGAGLLLLSIIALKMARDGDGRDGHAPAQGGPALPASPTPRRAPWRSPGTAFLWFLAVVALIRVFQIAGMGVAATFFNVYMDAGLGAPTAQIGVVSAVARLLAVPAALLTPVLAARWGHRGLIIGVSLVTTLVLLPMALVPTWWAAGAGFIGVIALSSIRYPAFSAFVMGMVAPEQRSVTSAVSEMTAGLSFAAMALLGGSIIARSGYPAVFLLGAGFTLLGTVIFWLYFRSPRTARTGTTQVAPKPAG